MEKFIACFLAAILAIPVLAEETSNVNYGQADTPAPGFNLVWEFERETSDGITYADITGVTIKNDTTTDGKYLIGDISVPLSLVCSDGTPLIVKKIADGTFANQIGITSISIPETVETLGTGLFTGCTILSQISVDENNPWLASSAGALYDKDHTRLLACPPRIETIQFPATLKEIGIKAFASCHRLAALAVPATVETIGAQAFLGCTRLTSVSFEGNAPAADASIIDGANANLCFYKKPSTTGWDAAPWDVFNVVESAAEQPSGIVSDKAGNVTWFYRVINGEAEIYNGGIAAIPTSTSETYTYNPATFEWTSDGKLVVPSSLGGYPVTLIGDYAFSGCSGISEVEMPKTLRRIGDYAFANCSSLSSVTLPTGTKEIGYRPFVGSSITALALPDSLRSLAGNPLAGCDTLLTVSISLDNSYYTVVNGILYDKDVRTLVGCPARKESASIATTTERIGPEAFDGCFRLRALLLPSNIASVGECAFCDMPRLASLVFPTSVTALEGAGLFEGCGSLEFIGFSGNAPDKDPQLFRGALAGLQIYVAQGTKGWNGDPSSTALPTSGKWPSDDEYGRSIANLDVSAEAELKEGDIFVCITTNGTTQYAHTLKVLAQRGVEILEISPKPIGNYTVPSDFISSLGTLTVKSLGDRLFANSTGLLSVEIPNAITNLGNEAFADCNVLMDVKLNHGLRSIGRHPFAGTAIETIALPDTVSTIDGNILYGCDPSVSLSVGGNNPYFAVSTEGAFYDKDFTTLFACPMTAEEIEIPATVTELADECLAGCIRLKKATFLGNAPTAADDVFADTPAAMTSYAKENAGFTSGTWKGRPIVIIPAEVVVDTNTDGTWKWTVNGGVATLYNGGDSALLDTNYNGAVGIPAEVTDSATGKKYTVVGLGDHALYGCRYVTAVTLPSTIESIGAEPFFGTKIATLSIPEYVAAIDGNPAAGCSRFTGFTVGDGNINFSADEAGCLYDHSKTTLLAVPPRSAEITVPATVTSIAGDAFAGCAILKKTTFLGDAPAAADTIFADTPAAMTSYAKENAGFTSGTWKGRQIVIVGGIDITNIIISETNTVGDIDYEMFWTYELHTNSTPLTATLKKLENAVGDVTIKNIVFVDGNLYTVTNIAAGAIADNPALLSATVPNTILEIGDEAFRNCTSLENVTLTYGIRYIGARVFLNTIVRELAVPDSLLDMRGNISAGTLFTLTLNIDDSSHFVYSDDGALFNRDMTKLYACPTRAEGTIILPETLTNICTDAFFGCHRLTYLNIPASVTTIGDGAFNVAGIWPGLSAPESTPHLESIFYNGTKPDAADDIYTGTPDTLVSYALTTNGWTDGEIWKDREVMVISGEDPPVLDYTDSNGITWKFKIINNNVTITGIEPKSTRGVPNVDVDVNDVRYTLEIPTIIRGFTVTSIGPSAFSDCTSLTYVGIPSSIQEIGDFAFSNCTAIIDICGLGFLTTTQDKGVIELPSGITRLGKHPFEGVPASTITLPYTLLETDGNPFAGCDFLTTVTIDGSCPNFSVAGNILYDKKGKSIVGAPANLEESSVAVPLTVTTIRNEAFAGCKNLESILLPESLEYIGTNAFAKCANISALTIPATVTEIGSAAFTGCNSLLSVAYDGNAPTAPDDLYAGTPEALTSYASSEAEGFTEPTWKDRPIDFVPPPPPQPLIYIDGAGVAWGYQIIEDDIAEIISVSSESAITALAFPSTIYALTVKGVGAGALASQRGITSISIPDTYEWIGDGAFSNCTSLASVTLAHGLRAIGRHPFEGTAIETIALPDTVSSIDSNILYGCDPSVSLSVGDNNPYFAESEEGALYDKDFTTLFACPMTTEALAVPATTTNVNDDAFADCIRLASIAFLGDAPAAADGIFADTPETLVISVLDGSLGWDGDPTSSALPASGLWRDRTIVAQNHTDGTWAWVVDGDLATLYNGGDSALLDKATSGEVVIPAEVTDSATGKKYTVVGIGDGAFSGCSKVTAVTLPDTIETIGAAPFAGTKISTLSIPAHVESIDGNPAAGCAYFTGFTVDEGNISFSADDGLLYNSTQTALLAVPARADDVTVPESVTSIADDAFAGCVALANVKFLGNAPTAADDVFADTPATLVISVLDGSLGWDGDPTSSTLPASGLWRDRKIERAPGEATKYTDSTGTEWDVTIYDNKAELGANGATPVIPASTSGEVTVPGEITIDDKTYAITAIPDGAFEGCSEITSINIPASITSIAADAFNGCTSLESFSVDSKNPAYSSRNGILYSKDGKTLVNVPAKTSFAATFTEKETASKKEIVEVIGSTDPDTMTTEPNQIIELKSYDTSTSTTATEFTPSISIDNILSGVTTISDYAFTDCGLMPEGSTVTGTLVVKVDEKETERKTGTFTLPVGTDSTGGHSYSYIYSQAGFYKGSVCLYHTASDSYKTISYAIPISIPTGISYSNLAFYNSHFTSKNKPDTPVPAPPVVVVNPPVDVPDDDSGDTNDGFGVTAILRDSNGNESAIKEGEVIEAHVGIKMSIPLSVGNAPDGSLSTVTAKGLPAGVKLAKTAVKEGRKVVKYIYAIEGTPSRAQSAKTVVLKVTNKKNKLNESVSFAIKVLAMPSWVGGKYNGVCFDGTTEIGSATATISAAGKISGKIMVPSDDGKKALKLSYTAKGFSGFDEESNTFYGTATMRVNKQTIDVPFALSAYNGAGQLSLELPGMTAALEQNTWKRGDIVATTIEVDGFKFKLSANGKVKWSGSVEGDNGRMLSVSGSTQLLSGPSVLVYIPPKSNLVGGRCELFQLQ